MNNEQLQAEIEEQARLLGMSGEREAKLLATISRLETENNFLKLVESNLHAEIKRLKAELAATRRCAACKGTGIEDDYFRCKACGGKGY